jgi:hypothetical protein
VKGRSPAVGGAFHITGTAIAMLPSLSREDAAALRRAMWDANRQEISLVVNSDVLTKGYYKRIPSFSQISEDILDRAIERAKPISSK